MNLIVITWEFYLEKYCIKLLGYHYYNTLRVDIEANLMVPIGLENIFQWNLSGYTFM